MINCIPIIRKENIIKEYYENDIKVIIPRLIYNHQKIELNESASFIVESTNGERTINDIVHLLEQRYKISSRDIAKEDVEMVIYMLWRFGIVGWKDGQWPYKEKYSKRFGEYLIEFISIESISKFLSECSKNTYEYCNPYRFKTKLINKNYLEQAVVNNYSYNFLLSKNDEVFAAAIVSIDHQELMMTFDYFTIINQDIFDEVTKNKWNLILNWIESRIFKESSVFIPPKLKSFNWMVLSMQDDNTLNILLDRMKYKDKVLLSQETTEGDVLLYLFERKIS